MTGGEVQRWLRERRARFSARIEDGDFIVTLSREGIEVRGSSSISLDDALEGAMHGWQQHDKSRGRP